MQIAVNPNRMELLKLKTRAKVAKRGHTLLRNKQDELMRQLNMRIAEYRGLRKEVETKLSSIVQQCIYARQMAAFSQVGEALFFQDKGFVLKTHTKKVMNLIVPDFSLEGDPVVPSYGFSQTPSELDRALQEFKALFPHVLKLAALEAGITLLAEETCKTRRRVNALEYVLIPRIQEMINYIEMKLDEFERATLTRLMRIKEIVQK